MIVADQVTKTYNGSPALVGVSFEAVPGRVLALLGPNGAGKTTMIKIFSTLIPPTSGSASIAGYDVATDGALVRQCIGLAGQNAAVDEHLTARENLEMFGRLYRIRGKRLRDRSELLLDRFQLGEIANRTVSTYSGGQRRRLDIAVSVIASPPVLFMDEPTTGLDPRSRNSVWELIREFRKAGATILLTTQYLEEADRLADEIVMLNRGQIVAQGSPDELKDQLGGTVVELTTQTPDHARRAVEIGLLLGFVRDETSDAGDPRQLVMSAPSTDGNSVDLLRDLDDAGISPGLFQVRRPTLDEVFLALTDSDSGD